MIPRIEQKLEINKYYYVDFLKWFHSKKGKILYPERIVCSRYFDSANLKMYYDTKEGLVPRKKIRIRTYGSNEFLSSNSSYQLEIKMTTESIRKKKIDKNINLDSLLDNGYFDNTYGLIHPLIDISYTREYFLIDGIRVTIDKDIKYKFIKSTSRIQSNAYQDNNYVVEIKANIDSDLNFILNNFNFPRSKFSKYERAVDSLNIRKTNY